LSSNLKILFKHLKIGELMNSDNLTGAHCTGSPLVKPHLAVESLNLGKKMKALEKVKQTTFLVYGFLATCTWVLLREKVPNPHCVPGFRSDESVDWRLVMPGHVVSGLGWAKVLSPPSALQSSLTNPLVGTSGGF
jgi:hypothetical protein